MAHHISNLRSVSRVRPAAATRPERPRFRAARSFYLVIFLFTCYAALALFSHSYHDTTRLSTNSRLSARATGPPVRSVDADEHCRLVHRADDQCTFVRTHCPVDDGGFSAYLELYFCSLAHAKPVAAIILIAWLGLLFSTIGIAASDFFCIDLSTIASILGLSESIAGVTLLAFGNGSPDVFSTFAAMSTHSGSLAVGELFGAAGFITAVVAGSMALIRPFKVSKKSFVRDVSFFIVAAAFSMVYLWDGKLRFWECVSMVGFYVFYVVFILIWHWWLGRRRRRREREAAVRGHYLPPDNELDFENGEYHDDFDEHAASRRPSIVPFGQSHEDFSALERASNTSYTGTGDGKDDDEEAEERYRDRLMTEIARQMRLTRPEFGPRSRKNTIKPVRPSLVGALEFQAVLSSLQKSRNIQTTPLMLRRFSDDPNMLLSQQEGRLRTSVSASAAEAGAAERSSLHLAPDAARPGQEPPFTDSIVPGRPRAVSANDASGLRIDNAFTRLNSTFQPSLVDIVSDDEESRRASPEALSDRVQIPQRSPTVHVEPATPLPDAPISAYETPITNSPDLLAPPSMPTVFQSNHDQYFGPGASRKNLHMSQDSPHMSPALQPLPRIFVQEDTPADASAHTTFPFPRFEDSPSAGALRSPRHTRPPSLHLPSPLLPSESTPLMHGQRTNDLARPSQWWPYSIMPPPSVLISALFPTIYHWHGKSWWEKCLGLVALPSVFLLTITLPVVENDKECEEDNSRPVEQPFLASPFPKPVDGEAHHLPNGAKRVPLDSNPASPGLGMTGHGSTATVAAHAEHRSQNYGAMPFRQNSFDRHSQHNLSPGLSSNNCEPQLWNRWLAVIQLFLAPMAIVLAIYIQSPVDLAPSWLIRPMLICLLVSTVLLIPLLGTTTPTYRPESFRIIFSLAGFIVSIAWISTVASQVVGAIKALAVILNMSHAIMGLTIFAVGNSLGDLVADVTVAKLGYPVMALSACFGGPMLNILLGIGLSGSYILLRGAEKRHAKHPEKDIHFKVYQIEVSKTLIMSGMTLLLTLVGLLIALPLNKWIFSRRIGWALIAVWTLATAGNVVVEVTGWPGQSDVWARWLGINSGNET